MKILIAEDDLAPRKGIDALRVEWAVKRIHLSEALAEEALCKGK